MSLSAVDPVRAHPTDAGIDFFAPKDMTTVCLEPGEQALIHTGVKVEIPYGVMGLMCNKSGVATKKELVLGAHVIDTFYSGEVIVNLHNIGKKAALIEPGDKLCQMVVVPIVCAQPILCDEDDLYSDFKQGELRGENGFGSGHTAASGADKK